MARLTILEDDWGIIQRDEDFIHHCKFREGRSTVTVDSGWMTITNPDGTSSLPINLVESDGEYTTDWAVPDDAEYGIYTVTIETEKDGISSVFENFFVILPWDITSQIRSISGIKQVNDINDRDLSLIAWNAYIEAKDDAFAKIIDEKITRINSSGTFFCENQWVMEDYLDSGEEAVSGYWKGVGCNCRERIMADDITLIDAEEGEMNVGNIRGCGLFISYKIQSQNFSDALFRKAIVYLASHDIILRFHELDKATVADLNSNSPLIIANPNRMREKYKQVMKKIKYKVVDGW
jgi:hypothetical protein